MTHRSWLAKSPLVALIGLLAGIAPIASFATVITAFPVDFSIGEQAQFNDIVATFEDDNPGATPSDFTTMIDWGDGTPPTAGTIGINSGAFDVLGQHTYADDGSFTVTVTISDVAPGTGTATATDTATVTERDALSGTPLTFHARAGVSFSTTVATFSDTLTATPASDFTATIDWGDATTSAGVVSGGSGAFQVSGTHTYAATGNYPVMVTLSDDAPGTATATTTSTAVINNSNLSVTATNFSAAEYTSFTGSVGSFTDVDTTKTAADFTATIDWGDGVTSSATVSGGSGSFTLSGPHTYADEGSYTVTLNVAENAPGTSTGNASGTATITEGDALSATAMTFNATTGSPFTGTVATFTDTATAAVASNFTATIDWGDGTTSTGTVVGGSGSFQVSGTHTYAAPGQYAVNVTISDPGGTATAAAASTANVVPAATPPTTPTPALGSAGAALLVGMVLAFGVWRRRALTRARTPRA